MKRVFKLIYSSVLAALLLVGILPTGIVLASDVYIDQTPAIIGSSGYVEYELKTDSVGELDIFWGTNNTDGLSFKSPELYNYGTSEWDVLTDMIDINSTGSYDGADRWEITSIGDVVNTEVYKVRVWVDVPWAGLDNSTGQIIFGYKPKTDTLREAIDSGSAYYITSSYDARWTNATEVIFDNPRGELSDVVVALDVGADDINWDRVQAEGTDIRCVDSDRGILLDYEIKGWDYGVEAQIWCRVPQIDGYSPYDSIIIFYGNSNANSGEATGLENAISLNTTYIKPNPSPPSNLAAKVMDSNKIELSWQKAAGSHNTIIVRKLGSYPDSMIDGATVYNGAAESYTDTGVEIGLTLDINKYYYRAWGVDVLGDISEDYTQKEVQGIMTEIILALALAGFAFWKREVWLYIIASIALLLFSMQWMAVSMYVGIAPFILALYMIFRAFTAWTAERR